MNHAAQNLTMSQQPPFIAGGGQHSWRRLSENTEHIFSPSEVSLEIVRIEKLRSSRSDLYTLSSSFI